LPQAHNEGVEHKLTALPPNTRLQCDRFTREIGDILSHFGVARS